MQNQPEMTPAATPEAVGVPESVALTLSTPEYRSEGPLKVSGRARYTADVRLPGMLWARFLQSPWPHARIVSVDSSAARAIPGVHAVLAGADIGLRRFGRWLYDWPVLAHGRVRYVGERVAAVAAETRDAAEEALNLIVVEYDELPAVFDAEEALADGAPILHPDAPDYQAAGRRKPVPHLNLQAYASADKGDPDIDRILATADLVVEDVFTGARQHQGFIEPHGCVVWIEPDGTVRVVSTNKSPFGLRQQLAMVTGLPPERIIVDSQFIGGDFGGKGTSIEEFACYYLAKATGRPIKAIMTYSDELQAGAPQHAAKYWLRTAVSRDGRMLAHESRAYLNNGAYGGGRPNPEVTVNGGLQCLDGYYVPNARLESFLASTNLAPGGNMRAPGAAHRGLAGEAHVDHIARELGMDPIEFRLKNAIRDGQTGLTGGTVHHSRAVEVLERLRHETAWGQTPLPPHRGRGIAARNRHVGEGRTELLYRLRPHGDVEVVTAAVDQGGGALTVIRRVAAAALSVDLERISVTYGNTSEARLDPGGVGGSRTTHVAGQAALRGAHTLKEKLEDLAAELMGWPSGQVRLEQDRFTASDGPGMSASFEEVAERILRGGPIEVVGAYDAAEQHVDDVGHQNFFAYMVEVDVDPATGRVQPTEVVLVVDVGTIINPIGHQGQLDGGFIFGYGQAATEELSHEDGRVTALSLGEYKLPTTMDAPRLRTILLDPDPGPGPFGAKAAGETTNTAVAGALSNAIYDAVGVRIGTMPITAERVFDALRRAGR